MPGLDVARGVAILMVLLDHGLASDQTIYQSYDTRSMLALDYVLRLGHMGVHLFFILSGFLITGILLDTRSEPHYFRDFYTRRALRILPAYLLLLAVLLLTHNITARYAAVCLLFLANMTGLFGTSNQYGALWSLGVEEQFYLTWPLTVRKLSLRHLTQLCIALIFLVPILRFALLYGPPSLHDIRFKTWAVADFFAAGALLAIASRIPQLRSNLQKLPIPLLFSGLLLITLQHFAPKSTSLTLINLHHAVYLEPWLIALTGFTLFTFLHPSIASHALSRPLLFLAKISYGLYLCHPLIFHLIDTRYPLHPASRFDLFPQLLLRFLIEVAIAILIATLSRYTFEEFFLRRKPKHASQPSRFEVETKIT